MGQKKRREISLLQCTYYTMHGHHYLFQNSKHKHSPCIQMEEKKQLRISICRYHFKLHFKCTTMKRRAFKIEFHFYFFSLSLIQIQILFNGTKSFTFITSIEWREFYFCWAAFIWYGMHCYHGFSGKIQNISKGKFWKWIHFQKFSMWCIGNYFVSRSNKDLILKRIPHSPANIFRHLQSRHYHSIPTQYR